MGLKQRQEQEEKFSVWKAEMEYFVGLIGSGEAPYSIPYNGKRYLTSEGKRLKELISQQYIKTVAEMGRKAAREWVQWKHIEHLDKFNAVFGEFNDAATDLIKCLDANSKSVLECNKVAEEKLKFHKDKMDALTAEYHAICDWAIQVGYVDKSDCVKGFSGFISKDSCDDPKNAPYLDPPTKFEDVEEPLGFWKRLGVGMGFSAPEPVVRYSPPPVKPPFLNMLNEQCSLISTLGRKPPDAPTLAPAISSGDSGEYLGPPEEKEGGQISQGQTMPIDKVVFDEEEWEVVSEKPIK